MALTTIDNCLQVVVAGCSGVGKSSIVIQWLQQRFLTDYEQTIEDRYLKKVVIEGSIKSIEVLDTTGQDDFSSYLERALRSGDGFLLVFSLTNKESFEEAYKIYQSIVKLRDRNDLPILFLGNKSDLVKERQISVEELERVANSLHVPVLECSATEFCYVHEGFERIIRSICDFKAAERAAGEALDVSVKSGNKTRARPCDIL